MLRPLLVAGVALLAAVAPAAAGGRDRLLAPAGRCAPQSDRAATVQAQERAMRCMVNFARRERGLRPLARAGRLMESADRKAADLLRCDAFSHTACGRPFEFHMRATGYATGCYRVGENLAWGSSRLGTVRAIMRSWLHSDGHRANLLDARYGRHGVALRTGSLSGHGGAAVWVHQLGHRC